MHAEVENFIQQCASKIDWNNLLVYEVGSYDVNGRSRDFVPCGWSEWVGFDLVAGLNVDRVGDATHLLLQEERKCDIIISTEVLEHCETWAELLCSMASTLKVGGNVILTCAGTGRIPHAADGSPNGPHDGEYYANVSIQEIEKVFEQVDVVSIFMEEISGDSRFFGVKQ